MNMKIKARLFQSVGLLAIVGPIVLGFLFWFRLRSTSSSREIEGMPSDTFYIMMEAGPIVILTMVVLIGAGLFFYGRRIQNKAALP